MHTDFILFLDINEGNRKFLPNSSHTHIYHTPHHTSEKAFQMRSTVFPINVFGSSLYRNKVSTSHKQETFTARWYPAILNTEISGNKLAGRGPKPEVTTFLIRMINLYKKAGKQNRAAHCDIFIL